MMGKPGRLSPAGSCFGSFYDTGMQTPVPKPFFSTYEGEPFCRCSICDGDLCEPGRTHIVLKYQHTRRDADPETIVEFACCLPCLNQHAPAPSEESQEVISRFRSERMASRPFLIMPPETGILTECETCGADLESCRTFSMRAEVEADADGVLQMSLRPSLAWVSGSPVLMCENCNTELTERISQETREGWDHFYDEFIDPAPVFEVDPAPRPVLV